MKNVTPELKVGLFAIIVVLVLSYMTFKVGGLPALWEKGYRLHATFNDISGLDEKSRIKIAGVESGVVDKIKLEDGRARLTLLIDPSIKIYGNARVSLKMSGLLGDRYLALAPGTPDYPLLKSGDTIEDVEPAADFDNLASELTAAARYMSSIATNLQSVLGDPEREALRATIHNLNALTDNLMVISTENREPLRNVLAQLDSFTKALNAKGPGMIDDVSEVARQWSEKGPELLDNLTRVTEEVSAMVKDNRKAFTESMENIQSASRSASEIAGKIERGEGTIGKLVEDETLYDSITKVSKSAEKSLDFVDRLRTFVDLYSEYNTDEGEWKGYFDLTLQPRKDKYYILGIVSDPVGSVETTKTTINGVTVEEEEVKSEIEFTAQFARRYEDVALRIGLMENTFGVGADYFFHGDRGRIKLDIWDFSADEAEADNAHARLGLDYRVFKYFFVSSGIDNLLNSNRRGIYVGGGVHFEDEDLKYLLGSGPNISLP